MISIVVQCYNHARFLRECLDSIARQTRRDFELIIIDDASTDDSVARIRAWMDEQPLPARLIALEKNLGVCRSLNMAIREARGDYLIGIATDDLWEPTLLEELAGRLDAQSPEYVGVYCDAWQVDEQGTPLPLSFIERYHHGDAPSGDIFPVLCDRNFLPASATMYRRSAYDEVGEHDEDLAYEDWDMWLRLSRGGLFAHVPERLAHYRVVQGSLVQTLFPDAQPSVDALVTHARMAVTLLTHPVRRPPNAAQWQERLVRSAVGLYRHGDPRAAGFLWAAVRHAPQQRPRNALLAVMASAGIPFDAAQRIRDTVRPERPATRGDHHVP